MVMAAANLQQAASPLESSVVGLDLAYPAQLPALIVSFLGLLRARIVFSGARLELLDLDAGSGLGARDQISQVSGETNNV